MAKAVKRDESKKEYHDTINTRADPPPKSEDIPKGRSSLRIDRGELMRELLDQPLLIQEWADSLALAKGEMDRLEAELELCEAEIMVAVKRDPEGYGLEKPTVDMIKAAVIRDNLYQKSLQHYNDARLEVGRLNAMVSALHAKKESLGIIVQLELSGLYGEVRIPKGEREQLSCETGRKQAKEIAY